MADEKIIFGNAIILEGEDFEVTRGYVVVEEGRIAEIGSGKPKGEFIDLKQGILCPSFTNAHTHIGDAAAQDYKAYLPIEQRVGKGGAKFEILSNQELVREGINFALREMYHQGISAFADFREGGVYGIEILKSSLSGSNLKALVLGRPDNCSPEEVLEVGDGLGIPSLQAYEFKELKKMRSLTRKKNKIFAIHAAEVEDDLSLVLKLSPDFVVHLTNAGEDALEELFSKGIGAVLCPRANAMLAVGIPKVEEILQNTLTALGTDNVMVNSLSMLREMEFAFKIARAQSRDYKFTAREILKAATINGRRLLGLESNAIAEGNPADFIVFRSNKYIYDPVLGVIHRFEKCQILRWL